MEDSLAQDSLGFETQQPSSNDVRQNEEEDGLFYDDVDGEDLDDMDFSDGGETSHIRGYDENLESLPQAACFDKDFVQVQEDTRQLLADVRTTIPTEHQNHTRYKHMFSEVDRLQHAPPSKKRKINIVGKSGSGKSSLLNCILGRPDAAKALAAGKGCTHVPTSYESPFPGQTSPCAAEVVFFSESEIRKKLELMLENYCAWHFEEESDSAAEEQQQNEDSAQTAFDAFRSLFCGEKEFATADNGECFLEGARKSQQDIVDKMTAWCRQLLPTNPSQESHKVDSTTAEASKNKCFEAETLQGIRDAVESCAFSSSAYKESSLWPIVKIVRVGIQGIRILEYATLIDWPGADDTNQLRANASAERIYDCDELWIVSSATRICTEPTVTGMLARYGGVMPCSIICTQIDANRDEELAAELKRQGHDTKTHDGLLREEKRLQKQIDVAEDKVAELRAIQQHGYTRRDGDRRRKVNKAIVDQKVAEFETGLLGRRESLATVEQQRLAAIIEVRQKFIDQDLSVRLTKHKNRGATLNLFFASNEHYMAHKGCKKVYGPILSVEDTGIPALRHHILISAAPRILTASEDYVGHQVAVLLEGIGVIIDPGSLQGCEKALEMVAQKETRLEPFRNWYLGELRRCVDARFVKPLTINLSGFEEAALKRLSSKGKWPFASIRAFIRRNGRHETKTVEWESWNEQFLEAAAEVILDQWEDFANGESNYFQRFQDDLIKECYDVLVKMDGSSAQYRLPKERFTRFFDAQIHGISKICTDSKADLKKQLGIARIEATQDDAENPSGYFSKAMQEVWDQAKEYKGAGSKNKILTAFEIHLKLKGERSPFAVVADSLAKAICDSAETQTRLVVEGVKQILRSIKEWLDTIFKEGVQDPEDPEIRDKLREFLQQAKPRFDDIQAGLKMIKRRYEGVPAVTVKQESR